MRLEVRRRTTGALVGADSERRRELLRETDRYHAELIEEVGEPSPEEVAEAWCDRIERHLKKVPDA